MTALLAANPPPLAMAEVTRPCPTTRAFYIELDDGSRMHVSFTTISAKTNALYRPNNHDINQTIIQLANHKPLKDY